MRTSFSEEEQDRNRNLKKVLYTVSQRTNQSWYTNTLHFQKKYEFYQLKKKLEKLHALFLQYN